MKVNYAFATIFFILIYVIVIAGCGNQGDMITSRTVDDISEINGGDIMHTFVLFETTMGNIKIELFDDTMPITAGNFKKLVGEGFYDGVIFHRVIPNFMAQGGDPSGTGSGGPGYNIQDEFSKNNKNDRGTLSMANAGPNTGGSQFFINVVNNNYLDGRHPVFGKVTEGMDIVDAMTKVKTGANDKPLEDIVIKKATILDE